MSNISTHPEQTLPSDHELLRAVASKDRDAFEQFYRRYHRRLYGYLLRWIDQPELVEEVLDDVLFVVWTDAAKFGGRSRVSTWIFGIAFRKAMRALEQRSRQPSTGGEELTDSSFDTSPGQLHRELQLSLEKAFDSLSPEHRTVVELTYFEDCSYQEIAEIVRCPVNTVKTRMFHARKKLREILPRLGFSHAMR